MEHRSSMLPTEKLRRAWHRRYCDRSLGWDLRFLNLPPVSHSIIATWPNRIHWFLDPGPRLDQHPETGEKSGPPFANDPPSQNTVRYASGSFVPAVTLRGTIRHIFFECPELTPVWQWAERCIVTITGILDSQVLSARNLILGNLSESS
ncbi:uncharacterized protein VTP21DRAFT_11732 [Calcarisporiella thermophila]|uniref:uncharacterized protein n=1 Tax=Calcarisporiella thermophila TaxID=911321 RepID=UPI0037423869